MLCLSNNNIEDIDHESTSFLISEEVTTKENNNSEIVLFPKESIKLLKFLRKPESINYARVIYLDENKRIPLVLDPEITKEIFTHKSIKAFDLWSYYQDLSKAHNLKHLNFYFTSTPLLLHGQTHRDSRLEILMLYKKLEPHLESWLESNIKPFFLSLSHDSLDSHIKITEFVLELLADLLQKSLN